MNLSRTDLKNISSSSGVVIPQEELFALPEKVLQFGTGVLLRGLPDYFIDKANRLGIFNGRIVVVKSTSNGGTDAFEKQDNLYTLCVRGLENGKEVEEYIVNSSISRVLSASDEWDEILACAGNAGMRIIISNTTEVGITLVDDDVKLSPPASFPGKLLAFLYERYRVFNGSTESGMVIIPTELITDNGTKLRAIVLELAKLNRLEDAFIHWLGHSNHFCNSLVDRIVPGKLSSADLAATEKKLGYTDELMIMAECFRLWAIESSDKKISSLLSFAKADDGVVITDNIERFRELKLRLLNGTHSFACGLAFLGGFNTVREAMENPDFLSFVYGLALNEIAPSIVSDQISYEDAASFARSVIERFKNPFSDHQWISIAVQYSSKMKLRNVPLLIKYYALRGQTPDHMALGFAAFLLFMKCAPDGKGKYQADSNGKNYTINDEQASYFANQWNGKDADAFVDIVLADKAFWGADLSALPNFADAVKLQLNNLSLNGVINTINRIELNKTVA
jgi:tagaturonate reductase